MSHESLSERRRQAKDFLDEHLGGQFPSELGPWVATDLFDPPWTRKELRDMRREGLIEYDEIGRRYRLTMKATKFRDAMSQHQETAT